VRLSLSRQFLESSALCLAQKVERNDNLYNDNLYNEQLNALQNKFGNVVGLLRTLPDFHLFALQPTGGRYIVGFGRAFTIDITNNSLKPNQITPLSITGKTQY